MFLHFSAFYFGSASVACHFVLPYTQYNTMAMTNTLILKQTKHCSILSQPQHDHWNKPLRPITDNDYDALKKVPFDLVQAATPLITTTQAESMAQKEDES
jgi:hypothetical protein